MRPSTQLPPDPQGNRFPTTAGWEVVAGKAGPRFRIRIRQDPEDGLFYVQCLDLQGCHTFGKSRSDAIEKIREAIVGHLAVSLHVGGGKRGKAGDVVDLVA